MRGPIGPSSTSRATSAGPTRRAVGFGLAASAGLLAAPRLARAQGSSLRYWSSQTPPVQMQTWEAICQACSAKNNGIKVEMEKYSDDTLWPKLTAAIAARDVPDLISYVQAYTVVSLGARGLVEPFDDVIKAVGEDDFFPS